MARRIKSEEFETEVLKSELPVLVEFYSDSCVPCKQVSPILADLEEDYEEKLKILKVNANYEADLVGEYHVMASPTFLFFKDGKEAERIRGLVKRKDLEDVIAKLV